MAAPHQVNFITGNANKLSEVRAILEPAGIVVSNQALDLPEIQGSLEDVTREKCRVAADLVKGPVLVEDTCLCFNALNGLPGPYIKWFMKSIGHVGLNNLLAAYEDKSAQAVATFGFCKGPGQEVLLFQGRTDPLFLDTLSFPPVSLYVPHEKKTPQLHDLYSCVIYDEAFTLTIKPGWDAVFEYEGETYAEMDKAKKNNISHRGKALDKIRQWIESGAMN
ncbi:hypothetical protein EKO27_g3962 [Xylaria grammica]|uniref:Inosine triphosphate pyrophosphatase n=1 Tax=Xylaria grammica TaxID=363999 RepID=A0A439D9V8_9PEZI|nr:hypothetical protein EKO27_g3962 [Xylaria grammica]